MLPEIAIPSPSARTQAARAGVLTLVLLSCGHFFADMYSGALGALQPLLVNRFGLTLAQAGMLGGFLVFSSSVMQPVYGFLSDRFHTRLFAALGPAVAGIFVSALGLAPAFGWLLALVWLGGAGIASFHPQASARAAVGLESRRGRAMAIFVSAGTLGYALGPAYFSTLATRVGLSHMYWGAVPGILVTVLLLWVLPPATHEGASRERFDWKPLRSVGRPLTILYLLVFIRSIIQITFAQLLPLYLNRERGFSVEAASYILSFYLAAGAFGGFLGGHLADRFGERQTILASMIGCVPFLATFFLTKGAASVAALMVSGFILLFTIPVNVVMAQRLAPSQAGTVSALMMGFAWGMAGLIFIPLVGWASDLSSMHSALASLTIFPFLGFFLALRLPKQAARSVA
jgi:FSR family fosmidomycin resistance protein-like MFS transporter